MSTHINGGVEYRLEPMHDQTSAVIQPTALFAEFVSVNGRMRYTGPLMSRPPKLRKPPPSHPPRVHVVFRPEAPVAVLIRTGGTLRRRKLSCTIGWERATDTFTMGQWLMGRLYPFECDISPDGAWMFYNALTGHWDDPVTKGSYGVLSRAPYLKAEKLWPYGDRWCSATLIWDLRKGDWNTCIAPEPCPPMPASFGVLVGGYNDRLIRDGWSFVREASSGDKHTVRVYVRLLGTGARLEKSLHANTTPKHRGPIVYETHRLVSADGEVEERPDWSWAEVDGSRVVWTSQGALHAAEIGEHGLQEPTTLYDCNGMTFEALEAPY